jgi:hypothetical protein
MAANEFEVEAILGDSVRGATHFYLVKWKGYDNPPDNTWEPVTALRGCRELLRAYQRRRARGAKQNALLAQPARSAGCFAHYTPTDIPEDQSEGIGSAKIARPKWSSRELAYECVSADGKILLISSRNLTRRNPQLLAEFLIESSGS